MGVAQILARESGWWEIPGSLFYACNFPIGLNFFQNLKKKKKKKKPWPDSSVGQSIIPRHQGSSFHPESGHTQESANE